MILNEQAVRVTLGAHTYDVVAQPLAYLEHKLDGAFGQLQAVKSAEDLADVDVADEGSTKRPGRTGFGELAGPAYDVLKVFIPDLMPEHEIRGYASEEAYAAGVVDEQLMRLTPTLPQIVNAFETVFQVNRIDVVKHLGKVIDTRTIQAFIKTAVGDSISGLLSSSLSPSGD